MQKINTSQINIQKHRTEVRSVPLKTLTNNSTPMTDPVLNASQLLNNNDGLDDKFENINEALNS